ncbi:MAG: hypothetical protein GX562_03375 [Coriobacteriaceae bacterium]|jgi:hypothetical protein|nr:hypothetical protein [Coriobacteriaceae bacterium]
MKHIGFCGKLILLVGVVLLGFSCSLVSDGCGQRFSEEQCDDPFWISQIGDTYSYRIRNASANGDSIAIEFKGFCGRDTVWELISNHDVLLPYELDISDVQADVLKLVLINEGTGGIRTIYPDGMDRLAPIELTPGKHTIKLIGYSAQGNLRMKLDIPLGVLAIDRFTERW